MTKDKNDAKDKAAGKAAYLILDGEGLRPIEFRGIPNPAGGWVPGKKYALSEIGISLADARTIASKMKNINLKGETK